jgi:hypothetical protein
MRLRSRYIEEVIGDALRSNVSAFAKDQQVKLRAAADTNGLPDIAPQQAVDNSERRELNPFPPHPCTMCSETVVSKLAPPGRRHRRF